MIRIGPFSLQEPLARGGMGEVWRGAHVDQRVPVAIKLTRPEGGRARAAFRDEVVAMAGLDHPGIVRVFDHGELSDEAAMASGGRLVAGSPYVVMEYASHGSLKGHTGSLPWSRVRGTLLSLLDALAHAHARGVIHRDIKPGNVLLSGPEDLRPGLKLADFGLARATDRIDELDSVTGTPLYMAPEQLTSRWRDFGPWTDLYALGVLAWELVTGRTPFDGRDLAGIVHGHLSGTLPPLVPRLPVPVGLPGWLLRMLQPDPRARFQRAADAAWALAGLTDPAEDGDAGAWSPLVSNPTLTLDDTLILQADFDDPDPPTASDLPDPMDRVIPPIPTGWAPPRVREAPLQLLGVGLGLFGLRSVPLVGRIGERDALWAALHAVHREGSVRVVALEGAAGNGKSRLVAWIGERAHEVGASHGMRAVHSPSPSPLDGLAPMVEQHLRLGGLDRAGVDERLARLLPGESADERMALAELVRPTGEGVRFRAPEERWALVARVIRRAGAERPVVVWLDDVQWGPDALGFAAFALRQENLPALVVLTVQSEALAERADAAAALAALLDHPRSTRIAVEPLGARDRLELVRVLLGLEGTLAERLAERAGGNPLFTIQLVADWVARGLLVPGQHGFELMPGTPIRLPDSLHEVWSERVERLFAGQGDRARELLEIAAALGQDVRADELAAIRSAAELPPEGPLVEAMIEARLAHPHELGWSFAHGMLRESVIRLAVDAGRWPLAHRRCADALAVADPVPYARLGRHLYAAGDAPGAADALARAVDRAASDEPNSPEYASLIELLERSLRRQNLPESDARWGELWLAKAQMLASRSRLAEAEREAARAQAAARRHRWRRTGARAEGHIAHLARMRGDAARAERLYVRAVEAAERAMPEITPVELARALTDLGHTRIMAGMLAEVEEPLTRARALYEQAGEVAGLAAIRRFEGDVLRLRLKYEEARACFLEASALNQVAGLRSNAASALHGVAEMERLLGNLDTAEGIYRDVIAMDLARGDAAEIPQLNLSLCQIARGRYADAREALDALLATWEAQHKRGYAAVAHVSLLPATAGVGDWRAFDRHAERAVVLCAETGMVDIDVAHAAERAGELARDAGQVERARVAWELALTQWGQLGETGRVDALHARIGALA